MNLFHDPKYILLCEQISSYTSFLNLYFLKYNFQGTNMQGTNMQGTNMQGTNNQRTNMQGFAIVCVSISSYLFHQKKYQNLKYNKPSTEIVPYIIADTFFIHLRSISSIKSYYSIPFHIISFTTKILHTNELETTFISVTPIIVDLILNFEINLCFSIYVIFLVLYIKPFRHMNFVFFHVLLFIQSYIKS
jgi:hypothetical protein